MKIPKILLGGLVLLLSMGFVSACNKQESSRQEKVELTREEKQKIKKQEETLALFLVNHFEGIKKIRFTNFTKGGFGTSDTIDVVMNDKIVISTDLKDSYDNYSFSYEKGEDLLIQKKVPSQLTSLNEIDVDFTEDK